MSLRSITLFVGSCAKTKRKGGLVIVYLVEKDINIHEVVVEVPSFQYDNWALVVEVPSFQYDNWALISRSKYRLKANRRDSLVVDKASPWKYIFYGFSSILPFRNGREFVVVRKFGWCQCGIVFPISFFLDYVSLKCNASIYSLI